MINHKALRLSLAAMLCGGTLLASGCGDLIRRSVRDGAIALIAGNAASYFDPSGLNNLLTNMVTGGFTGGWDGFGNSRDWPFPWPGTSQGT